MFTRFDLYSRGSCHLEDFKLWQQLYTHNRDSSGELNYHLTKDVYLYLMKLYLTDAKLIRHSTAPEETRSIIPQ